VRVGLKPIVKTKDPDLIVHPFNCSVPGRAGAGRWSRRGRGSSGKHTQFQEIKSLNAAYNIH